MATINVTLPDLAKEFLEMPGRIRDFKPPMRAVALYLSSASRMCFAESRAPDGTPWLPLKNPSKRRGGSSAKPLRDTGILMASLTTQGAGHKEEIDDTGLTWGTDVSYATFHQDGTRTIPARPFLGVTPALEQRISDIIGDWVERELLKGL